MAINRLTELKRVLMLVWPKILRLKMFWYMLLCGHKKYNINLQCSSVSILIAPVDISSLEIAFLKAVMLPPEIARFCVAVFFSNLASFKRSVNQPNLIRSVLLLDTRLSTTFKVINVCPKQI